MSGTLAGSTGSMVMRTGRKVGTQQGGSKQSGYNAPCQSIGTGRLLHCKGTQGVFSLVFDNVMPFVTVLSTLRILLPRISLRVSEDLVEGVFDLLMLRYVRLDGLDESLHVLAEGRRPLARFAWFLVLFDVAE